MGIRIILRREAAINMFRDLLINTACSNIGDKILICSGFFQERKSSRYSASSEKNFIHKFKKTKKEIITIGIHNYTWLGSYMNFVNEFRNLGIPIKAFKRKRFNWHAKMYFLFEKDTPIFAIIGSSNITRNAFSDNVPFNIEADVVLWSDTRLNYIIDECFNNIAPENYYNVDYSAQNNNGKTIQDRLFDLYKEIMAENVNDVEI